MSILQVDGVKIADLDDASAEILLRLAADCEGHGLRAARIDLKRPSVFTMPSWQRGLLDTATEEHITADFAVLFCPSHTATRDLSRLLGM